MVCATCVGGLCAPPVHAPKDFATLNIDPSKSFNETIRLLGGREGLGAAQLLRHRRYFVKKIRALAIIELAADFRVEMRTRLSHNCVSQLRRCDLAGGLWATQQLPKSGWMT